MPDAPGGGGGIEAGLLRAGGGAVGGLVRGVLLVGGGAVGGLDRVAGPETPGDFVRATATADGGFDPGIGIAPLGERVRAGADGALGGFDPGIGIAPLGERVRAGADGGLDPGIGIALLGERGRSAAGAPVGEPARAAAGGAPVGEAARGAAGVATGGALDGDCARMIPDACWSFVSMILCSSALRSGEPGGGGGTVRGFERPAGAAAAAAG
ncbi:MAG: hypothetical protein JO257_24580, partial [Deltaproteobacteria bacterium]|nr:hypothetical protein [Deltaproteobacteria bacterium]